MGWLRSGLRDAGDEVHLLTSSAGSAADGTAEHVAYGTGRVAAQVFLQIANPFAMRAVRRAMNDFRPDIVFVNMFAHHLSPAIFHAMGDVPVVVSVSDYKCICPVGSKLWPDNSICTVLAGRICYETGCVSLPHWIRDRPRYALLNSALARANRVIACSDWVRNELERAGIEAECVHLPVPNPGPEYARAPSPEPGILFCGRLDLEKGVEQLLRAFAVVVSVKPLATLRLAGRGPERGRLEALARELSIDRRVTFLGWLEPAGVERELATAWVLAAPSIWAEPLGLVALEAMVRRVPVVASAIGGFSETVEHGVSGMLVPNGDVTALANALITILDSFDGGRGLSDEVALRISERHDVSRHIARMRSTFSDVVSQHGTGRKLGLASREYR